MPTLKKTLFFGLVARIPSLPLLAAQDNPLNLNYHPGAGLILENQDKSYTGTLHYLMQSAVMQFYGAPQLKNGTNIQRAKALLSGNFKALQYDFSYEFIENELENAHIGLSTAWGSVAVGQVSPSFGLQNTGDDQALPMLDSTMIVQAISPPYVQGISLSANSEHWTTQLSLFGRGSSQMPIDASPLGGTWRLAYVPWHQPHRVLHFGLSAWQQTTAPDRSVDFSTTPELPLHRGTTLINTGEIDDVGNYTVGDLEFASINGPFALSAEYLYSWIHRNEQSTLNFNGYYLNASYFLTGESRLYSYPGAYFTGITAINNKKLGAWQILAQYSALDLNSQNINGGDEKNFSIGINWYINAITELMFNYVHADASANQAGPHTVANAYGLQLQLFF